MLELPEGTIGACYEEGRLILFYGYEFGYIVQVDENGKTLEYHDCATLYEARKKFFTLLERDFNFGDLGGLW